MSDDIEDRAQILLLESLERSYGIFWEENSYATR